jgi:hypothetical protein
MLHETRYHLSTDKSSATMTMGDIQQQLTKKRVADN